MASKRSERTDVVDVVFDMETHDPDDCLTFLFLASHPRFRLKAVTLVPGTAEQVGLVESLLKRLEHPDIPIGADFPALSQKQIDGAINPWHCRAYFPQGAYPRSSQARPAWEVLSESCDATTVLITGGPLTNVAAAIEHTNGQFVARALLAQGGFAGCNIVPADAVLPKFAGKTVMTTFNFGANLPAARVALAHPGFGQRRLVSKNVCHHQSNMFTADRLHELQANVRAAGISISSLQEMLTGHGISVGFERGSSFANDAVGRRRVLGLLLIAQGMHEYLRRGKDGKLLHDPLAAAAALGQGVISEWAEVQMFEDKQHHWGAQPCAGSGTFISVRHSPEQFWKHFLSLDSFDVSSTNAETRWHS